jgi:ethanolaminephosphotransferase
MSGFYLSGLEEKFTGIFEFGYISGPTEGLVLIFIFHLMAAFYKEHVEKIITATTLSPQVSQSLNISNVSPLFLLCFFVAIFNILSSYWKSCRLGDLKSKTVVTKCYLKTALVFLPLFILHKKLDYSPKLQMINLLIFSQCFSLNYIEDVFSTIVNSSKRRRNWVFIAYLMFCLSFIFFDVDNYSLGLYSFLTISLSHYVYNVFLLVKLCKKSLKINVFTLNRKAKTQ